jgi:uncharacterized CHY-type Zn-finger protein
MEGQALDHSKMTPLIITDRKVRPVWCGSCHKKAIYQDMLHGFKCVNCRRRYVYV